MENQFCESMKSRLIFFATLLMVASMTQSITASSSFKNSYENASWLLSPGIGLGLGGFYGSTSIPPISIALDRQTEIGSEKLPFSFGGYAAYSSSSENFASVKFSYSYIIVGARGLFYFNRWVKVSNLDLYAGLLIGYNIVTVSSSSPLLGYSVGASALVATALAGARYYLSQNIGIFGELGFGSGYGALTVGMTFKF